MRLWTKVLFGLLVSAALPGAAVVRHFELDRLVARGVFSWS